MEKKLTLQEIFDRIQEMFGYDMETEEVTELRKILPNDPSETEIEIALNDYHSGMEIDSIVDHLIWG